MHRFITKYKKFLFSSSLIVVVGVAGFFVTDRLNSIFFPKAKLDREFLSCMSSPGPLDVNRCIASQIKGWIASYGVAAMVGELSMYQNTVADDSLCHYAGHEVGKAVFEAEGESLAKGITACTLACHQSCVHGVLLGYSSTFGNNVVKQILTHHPEDQCATSGINKQKVGGIGCSHGFGHVFMIAENYNVTAALHDCDQLHSTGELDSACPNGVYMVIQDAVNGLGDDVTLPRSAWYKRNDTFYPCNVAPAIEKSSYFQGCMSEKVFNLFITQQTLPLSWCNDAPLGATLLCARAMGSAAGIKGLTYASTISMCEQAEDPDIRNACLSGAAAHNLRTEDGTKKYAAFCALLSPEEKSACDLSALKPPSVNVSGTI